MTSLSDARLFPVDMDVPGRQVSLLELDPEVLEQSAFMDTRMTAPLEQARPMPIQDVLAADIPHAAIGWIFHTSFCCSTLLARALHSPPHQVVLKEPLVLRRLADARHGEMAVAGLLEPVLQLLGRPWHADGSVVIKPTHAALNIAADLLAARPDSRALVITSSLEDFLVSNMKKSQDTQRKIPALVERAFSACSLHSRLPPQAFDPPDALAGAALQWAAQREICLDLLEARGPDTIRVLDAADFLADLPAATWRCAQWLRLSVPRDTLELRVAEVGKRNAKDVAVAYRSEHRTAETEILKARYRDHIDGTVRWFDRLVAPAMRAQALALSDTSKGTAALLRQ